MFLRFSNIPLRHCWRNTHNGYVSRTHYLKRIHTNSPDCGVISAGFVNSRYYCTQQAEEDVKRVTILFKKANGEILKRRGEVGETLHDIIGQDNVNMIGYGICGGTLSCSTCHIILSKEDMAKVKEKVTDEELDLIGYAPENCENSRLGCCIKITEEMDGMVVNVPAYVKDQREEFN